MKLLEVIKFNFKIYKKTILMWSIILFFVMSLYMILFPCVKEIAQEKIDVMPVQLTEIFNISSISDMTDFTYYFKTIYKIIIIVISVFAINFSSSLITDEEKNKTMNFLINQDITRNDIYLSKLITAFISTLFIAFLCLISASVCAVISGEDLLILKNIFINGSIISIIPFIFISSSFLFSGYSYKNSKALSLSFLFIVYMIGYLGTLLESNFLLNISPFITMDVEFSNFGVFTIIYFILFILFSFLGLKFYKKRDLSI